MGLMLSVLVFCVGVLEALSCLEYIRSSYLPFEMKKRKRRLIIDLNTGKARHVDAIWPSDISHDHIIKKRSGLASLPNSLEQEEQDESVVSSRKEQSFTPEELQHALSAVLFEAEEDQLGEEEEEEEEDEEEEEELLQEEETSEDTTTTTTDDLTQIFKPIHSTKIMQPPINDNNIKDIMGPLDISTTSNNNNLIQENVIIEKAVIEENLKQKEKFVEPKLSETLIESNRLDSITKYETHEINKTLTKEPQAECIENQPKELSSVISKQEEIRETSELAEIPVKQTSAETEQEIFTDSNNTFSSASTVDEDIFHDAYTRSTVTTADSVTVTKIENKLKHEELSENNLKENARSIIISAELPPKKTEEIKQETSEKQDNFEKKVGNCDIMEKKLLNSNCEPCARKKTVQTQYKQDFTNMVVQNTDKVKEKQAGVEENEEESRKSNVNNKSIIVELGVKEGHIEINENKADKIGNKTEAVIDSSLENDAIEKNFTDNKSISEQNHSEPLHVSVVNSAENNAEKLTENLENSSKLKKESSPVEGVQNVAAKTESKEVMALSNTAENDNKIEWKVETVKKEKETVAVDKQEKTSAKDTKIKTNTNKNKLDTQIKKAVETIDKKEDNEKRIIDIELVECVGCSSGGHGKNDEETTLPDGNVDHQTLPMKSSFQEIYDDKNTVKLKPSDPMKAVELEKMDDPTSPDKAFWLIFSGEYTKAMSKDWHSGHFCCWQCDESLTGQRYVLRDDHPYCIKCYESVFANTCDECNKTIGIDSKDLSYKDKHWHEACFFCNKCKVSLVDKQFGSKADKIYCGNCYDAQFASRCDGCGQIFRAGTKKMEYKTRQWHEQCFCCCVCKTPIGTKSFIPREQEIYCATCYEEKFATRCVKCNKIITSGGVTYKNEPWHRECFTCTNCNTSLAGQRFTSREEKPYCADCFGELFAKRCTACCKPITGIGGTRFISFEDRHWHNDCFICAACRSSLVGRGFITDADDILCTECAKQKLM